MSKERQEAMENLVEKIKEEFRLENVLLTAIKTPESRLGEMFFFVKN